MHRFSLFATAVVLVLAQIGCGGKANPMSGTEALNENDEALLKYINLVQQDSIEAIDRAQAFHPNVSDKVTKMSGMIEAGNCTHVRQMPDDRFDRDWSARVEVDGGLSCPIVSSRRSNFDVDRGEWNVSERFVNSKSEDYKKLDPLISKTVGGALTLRKLPGQTKISGQIKYSNFEIADIGPVEVTIDTQQEYQGSRGGGTLLMEMIVNRERKYVVEMKWDGNMSTTYRINTRESEKKVVHGLFSALGLIEIVDRSSKMR